jgi:hypothetical protein
MEQMMSQMRVTVAPYQFVLPFELIIFCSSSFLPFFFFFFYFFFKKKERKERSLVFM